MTRIICMRYAARLMQHHAGTSQDLHDVREVALRPDAVLCARIRAVKKA